MEESDAVAFYALTTLQEILDGKEAAHYLKELLAVIHRDGGHHTEKVGFAQSVEDACAEWYRSRS